MLWNLFLKLNKNLLIRIATQQKDIILKLALVCWWITWEKIFFFLQQKIHNINNLIFLRTFQWITIWRSNIRSQTWSNSIDFLKSKILHTHTHIHVNKYTQLKLSNSTWLEFRFCFRFDFKTLYFTIVLQLYLFVMKWNN